MSRKTPGSPARVSTTRASRAIGLSKARLRSLAQRAPKYWQLYRAASFLRTRAARVLPDPLYARIKYRENTGRILDLAAPTSFNEKLWWLKLNNRDPLLRKCSDKVAVRDYVRDCGFAWTLVPSLGVFDGVRELSVSALPKPAFLKTTHGSGGNYLWDPSRQRNTEIARAQLAPYLKSDYFWQSREWNYRGIPRRIIAEEIIDDADLVDYRFLCFDGRVRMIFVDIGTAAADGQHAFGARRNVYSPDFTLLPLKARRDNFPQELVERPSNLNEMIEIAEALSEPFVFCRVDLYNVRGKILFGEMTFYPGGGAQLVEPHEWELEMGSWIDLNSAKIVRNTVAAR